MNVESANDDSMLRRRDCGDELTDAAIIEIAKGCSGLQSLNVGCVGGGIVACGRERERGGAMVARWVGGGGGASDGAAAAAEWGGAAGLPGGALCRGCIKLTDAAMIAKRFEVEAFPTLVLATVSGNGGEGGGVGERRRES